MLWLGAPPLYVLSLSLSLYVSLSLWVSLPVGYDDGLMTDALARRTDPMHIHPRPMLTISSCVPITYFYTFLHIFALIQTCFSARQKNFFRHFSQCLQGFREVSEFFCCFFFGVWDNCTRSQGTGQPIRRARTTASGDDERPHNARS